MSEIILGGTTKTRHESRFGITSFVYKARRPFVPSRFNEDFVEPYFMNVLAAGCEEGASEDASEEVDDDMQDNAAAPPLPPAHAENLQKEAAKKQSKRTNFMGNLLRMKGFIWLPYAHDLKGTVGQAGNMIKIDMDTIWNVLDKKAYSSKNDNQEQIAELRKDFQAPWGDRRQELVFIGQNLKHEYIQLLLDDCLMTDDEFEMGLDAWKAIYGDVFLDGGDAEAYSEDK